MSWRELSDEEARGALDCSNLSSQGRQQVREEFKAASIQALTALVKHLGRVPLQTEVDWLHAKLVAWFNEERIPLIVPEILH